MEALAVLAILAVLAAAAIPAASHYIKLAEFRKNEANAKTAYLAAESVLTWYRASGEWENFRREIIQKGTPNQTFGETAADVEKNNRIYAVTLNSSQAEEPSISQELVRTLLGDCAYDQDFLNAAIAIEIDIETGQVYSAFYGTRCERLSYEEESGSVNISAAEGNRAYDSRKDRLLGYYSVEDVSNVVELKPIRLKVTSINLVNSETLSLNWSSNSRHNNLDVDFTLTFYDSEDGSELFSTQVNRSALTEQGWSGSQMVTLTLKDAQGKTQDWDFPLYYQEGGSGQNGRFSLILDAMMSASLLESLNAHEKDSKNSPARTSSTSITRLSSQIPALEKPRDIYAVVKAEADYSRMTGDFREYRESLPVTSNTENTLFVRGCKEENGTLEAEITRFRHLSNIRYADPKETAVFTVTARNMDWTAAGTGLYDASMGDGANGRTVRLLRWKESAAGPLDFPSIPLLPQKHTLKGTATSASLSNLHLGAESVPGDSVMNGIYGTGTYSRYLGLFCEAEGTIRDLTFQNPVLLLAGEGEAPALDFGHLYGIGLLCGRSQGRLENISVNVTSKDAKTLTVCLPGRETGSGDIQPAGIGGLVGVLAKEQEDGTLAALQDSSTARIRNLAMEGSVNAILPVPEKPSGGTDPETAADHYSYGIGGIFGYARIGGDVQVRDCSNHAQVTGNLFTGGIGGRMTSDYAVPLSLNASGIVDCENDGLILCAETAAKDEAEAQLEGRYFGGILGYGSHVRIVTSSSASGRAAGYRYSGAQRENVLLGQYVGGIVGYGNVCRLSGCSTKNGGFILGSDYVGGIAGGLSNDIQYAITGDSSVSVTANASYVIGNSYVGGIVGKNDGPMPTTIQNCVNNGVAAGYGRFIGGIAGYNGENGTLLNCASYLSDYDHSLYNTIIKEWKTTGDCVGGLAGYNNGKIRFDAQDAAAPVRSVSSIVTGRNFVGGVIGFNDKNGEIKADYELIGGQIYASGTGAGGAVGLNASSQLLTETLFVRPVSVEGNLCVGGCIGISLADLKADTVMDGFRAVNSLGTIKGTAFTGGIIGYHRTYTEEQLGGIPLAQYLQAEMELSSPDAGSLLPKLDESNLPSPVIESQNTCRLIISNKENDKVTLDSANNNISIQSFAYAGGIVGYCERSSRLILRNCRNSGKISRPENPAENPAAQGVSIKAYLAREGMGSAADQIGEIRVSMIGGILSANMEHQVIDHCVNTGSMNGFVGLGGIVGFNAGGVFCCELADNFGNAQLDYIGGIAGLNIRAGNASDVYTYTDISEKEWNYTSGTIAGCSTRAGRTVSGRSYVGGIAGFNLPGGLLTENENHAGVTAAGDYAGGIAGANAGRIETAEDGSSSSRTVTGNSGQGIGGLAGWNKSTGSIAVKSSHAAAEEVIAVGEEVRVTGQKQVGGIVGFNEGNLTASGDGQYLTAKAREVRALSGYAGGIAGEASGNGGKILRARNRCRQVTSNAGPAGGIVAVNSPGMLLESCENLGNVNSDDGYAGGIAALNLGTISRCRSGNETESVTLSSHGVSVIGGICAVNQRTAESCGIISDSRTSANVTLSGTAKTAGGIAGANEGVIQNTSSDAAVSSMPEISLSGSRLFIGGVAGENREKGIIRQVRAEGLSFADFRNYRYLGGIVGENLENALVENCTFSKGSMRESKSAAGNCYGGIAGNNSGTLKDCTVSQIRMEISGVYTATSTSTAQQKEDLASHAGGIAGKNGETACITGCHMEGPEGKDASIISAGSGMAGGITGFNKGRITLSGGSGTKELMQGLKEPSDANFQASVKLLKENTKHLSADTSYVNWNNGAALKDHTYNGSTRKVSEERSLTLTMSTNGNLGGITAYNARTGQIDRCSTGNWYLNNQSGAIGVGTGGAVGMNESEKELSFLVNRAFVGRELSGGDTNRFAGGIIGNQNNTTLEGWKIRGCINYGTVYCQNTHYSGGILGQWTGTGGTVEQCFNYGNLQTTYAAGWVGAAGGIVAQLYHAYENNEYNIISCGNYGSIYGRDGRSTASCANDSAGILGNVTAFRADQAAIGQSYTIQVLDCVNGSGAEIYSNSMASGIVGFFSCDDPDYSRIVNATGNITLRIERCRNFSSALSGSGFVGGILGERYGAAGSANTVLKDCYSLNRSGSFYNKTNNPVVSYGNGSNAGNAASIQAASNYYLDESATSFSGYKRVDTVGNALLRAGTGRAYLTTVDGVRYAAFLQPGQFVNSALFTLNGDDIFSSGTKAGQVLFRLDRFEKTGTMSEIAEKGSLFDEDVRKAYHKVEDVENLIQSGPNPVIGKMKPPAGITLTVAGKQARIQVTPAPGTDPFRYKAVLTTGSGSLRTIEFYSEDHSFSLTSQEAALLKSGILKVAVRACSMFEEVADSDPVEKESGQIVKILPDPEIRIELVENGSSYAYRFCLANEEDYLDCGTGWYISVKLMDGSGGTDRTELKIAPGGKSAVYTGLKSGSLQQLLVQAVSTGADTLPSGQLSVPVYLPCYKPSLALKADGAVKTAVPEYTVTGSSLEDLSITVTLNAETSGSITTTPIYRAELIGTWNAGEKDEQTEAVLSQTDILASAGGKVSAVFSDFPEYLETYASHLSNLRIRIWYAQPGLGPVYTYYPAETKANIFLLTDVTARTENGTEVPEALWETMYSPVLENKTTFSSYKAWLPNAEALFTWLDRPELEEKADLRTDTGSTKDRMQYTFRWDQAAGAYEPGSVYVVSLTGILEGKRVSLVTGREVSGNSLSVDAEDWSYEEVELTVTRKGDAAAKKIGLSASRVYPVKQRLPRPAQPSVSNPNADELHYTVEWNPVLPEQGCASYAVYLQPYKEDGTLDLPVALEENVLVSEKEENGLYRRTLNLEDYAGTKALLFLVAQPEEDSTKYVNSVNGVTFEVEIPSRIKTPAVTWEKSWEYDRNSPIPAALFQAADETQSGGLHVRVHPADAAGIPPGDSSYLLKAYVFESREAAEAARADLEKGLEEDNIPGLLLTYPLKYGNAFTPTAMVMESSTSYLHTLRQLSAEYAGRFILFFTRISSGNGQVSSKWTANPAVWQLPYVKLAQPALSGGSRELNITAVNNLNPDLPVKETWKAAHKQIQWESVELADCYYVTLMPKDGKTAPRHFKITETETGTGESTHREVRVFQKAADENGRVSWNEIPGTETDGIQSFRLSGYSMEVSGTYTKAGLSIPYTVWADAGLEAVRLEGGKVSYTLILPDADSLKPVPDITIAEESLRPTASVSIYADVKENDPDDPDKTSSAYIPSDSGTVDLGN